MRSRHRAEPFPRWLGLGRRVLAHARDIAAPADCYKVHLATGSKRETTIRFYEVASLQTSLMLLERKATQPGAIARRRASRSSCSHMMGAGPAAPVLTLAIA